MHRERRDREPPPHSQLEIWKLDRGTLAAARSAGIPEDSLKEMAWLIGAKRNKVEEIPIPEEEDDGAGVDGDFLDEPGDFEETADLGGKDLIETAVVQLTRLVSALARDKRKKGQDLEALLDQREQLGFGQHLLGGSPQPRYSTEGLEGSDQGFQREPQTDVRSHRGPDGEGFQSHSGGSELRSVFGQGLALQSVSHGQLPEPREVELASRRHTRRPCC